MGRTEDLKKKWYENKKEEILKKQNQVVECKCGISVSLVNLNRHRKTHYHIEKMSVEGSSAELKPDIVHCGCGVGVLRCNLYNHQKSKTHLSYLAEMLSEEFNEMDI